MRSCPAPRGKVTAWTAVVTARVRPGARIAEPYPTYGGHSTHTASGSRVPYASKDTSGGYEEYARDKPRKPKTGLTAIVTPGVFSTLTQLHTKVLLDVVHLGRRQHLAHGENGVAGRFAQPAGRGHIDSCVRESVSTRGG